MPITAVGIIPARWGATRFPGKLLADLDGMPVIGHTWRRASSCARLAELLVATDDQRIADAVAAAGGRAVMTSPDCASGTDRVAEAVSGLDRFEVVVNIQGDEPLIRPGTIDSLVAAFDDPAVEIATIKTHLRSLEELASPHVVKVVCDRQNNALYFSRFPIPFSRNSRVDVGHGPGLGFKHVGLYAYRRRTLLRLAQLPPSTLERAEGLEQLRFLEGGYRIRVLYTAEESVGVDTPEDLEHIRQLSGLPPGRATD
jgi:3-deoxy-manno-octulosonate cytidylyltransferase (CMP-KDO synthetase)